MSDIKVGSATFGVYPKVDGASLVSQLNASCKQAASTSTSTLNSGFANAGTQLGQSLTTSFSSAVKNLAHVATAAISVAGVGLSSFVKSSVSEFAQYEQMVGGVEMILKDAKDTVIKYADEAAAAAGMSANQYLDNTIKFSGRLLQSVGGDAKKAVELANLALKDMGDNANAMGTSLESVQYAYQGFSRGVYTMLDNLRLGYGGTQEEAMRLVKDAGLVQREFNSINDISFGELIESIHIIQERMGITGTTAREAAHTIQGSLNWMKAAWSNLKMAMANPEADVNKYFDAWLLAAESFGSNVIPIIGRALESISGVVDRLAPEITARIPDFVQNVLPGFIRAATQIAAEIVKQLPAILAEVWKSLTELGMNGNPWESLLLKFIIIKGAIGLQAKLFGGQLKNIFVGVAGVIGNSLSKAFSKMMFSNVINDLQPLRDVSSSFTGAGNSASKGAKGVSQFGESISKTSKTTSKAAANFKQLAGSALQIAAIGVAIAAAGVGFKLMGEGAAMVGQAGTGAVVALALMGGILIGFVVVLAKLGKQLTVSAVGIAALGLSVALAGIGFKQMAEGAAAIGNAGGGAIAALAIMSATLIGLVVVLAIFAPALVVATPFVLAFGAAIMMAGVGIGAATAGIALMVTSITGLIGALPIAAEYGNLAAGAFLALAGGLLGIAGSCIAVTAGLVAMALGFTTILAPLAIVTAELVLFSGTMLLVTGLSAALAAGFLVAAGGAAALGTIIAGIRNDCDAAVGAMWNLQGSVDTVGNSIAALGEMAGSVVDGITGLFNNLASSATASFDSMWASLVAGCQAGGAQVVAACQWMVDAANGALNNLGDSAYWAGVRFGESFASGIRSTAGTVADAAASILSTARNNVASYRAQNNANGGYMPANDQLGDINANGGFAAQLTGSLSRTNDYDVANNTNTLQQQRPVTININGTRINDDDQVLDLFGQAFKRLQAKGAM